MMKYPDDIQIQVRNVCKSFRSGLFSKRETVLSNVSFHVLSGRIFSIVGDSGSGKSTLAGLLTGALAPDCGEIEVAGRRVHSLSAEERFAHVRTIQLLYQSPQESLDPEMTLWRSLMEPLQIHEPFKQARNEATVLHLLDEVGLSPAILQKYPHQISGGEAQRLVLVRALSLQPQILILDEATAMLDALTQLSILKLLKRLQKKHSLTYLFISHDLELVRCFCDDILILKNGSIIEWGSVKNVMHNPEHPYTMELIDAYRL